MSTAPSCPYCEGPATLVRGDAIYPHRDDLHELNFWSCAPCGAYVGCHRAGTHRVEGGRRIPHTGVEPLGRLANAQLRAAKGSAHQAFDPLWKSLGWNRRQAYAWLAERMGLPLERTHIGEFDIDQCMQVVRHSMALRQGDGDVSRPATRGGPGWQSPSRRQPAQPRPGTCC